MTLSIGTMTPGFAARPTHGGAIILPALSDYEAHTPIPSGWTLATPYLRVVPTPRD
ncbi:MAG: hypothetical protein ABIT04_04540 [Novosphingobium sp.]